MSLGPRLERYFEFQTLGANWRTEVLAGFTTFMTMAYIVFVNPAILHETGMPLAAVTAATCISAAAGSFLMGGFARYPIALAPGMGLNAYFTYAVVKGMGVPWQAALGAVFLSGVAFLLLTLLGVRQLILSAIPHELYAAVAAGVGLFIAFIGFRNSGIIVPNPATTVTLGNLTDKSTALALFGLLLISALLAWRVRSAMLIGIPDTPPRRALVRPLLISARLAWRVRSAMLIGILATTAAGLLTGVAKWAPQTYSLGDLAATAGKLDIAAALRIGFLEIVFVFLFIDLFDNIGTLVAVGKKANLFDKVGQIPRLNRILFSDAIATIVGACSGTSTVVSYIESAAGVAAGGRTGVTGIVTGLLFILALFIAPVVGATPAAATAPALIVVGSMMVSVVGEIAWSDPEVAIPAFLTMMTIPLTFRDRKS